MQSPTTAVARVRVRTLQRIAVAISSLTIVPLLAIGMTLVVDALAPPMAQAKTPGKTYCFYGRCHRVRTIEETRRAVGKQMIVRASFYDDAKRDRYNPSNVTSSGEYFRADRADNAASPIWPDGTMLLVWNPANKRSAVVRINNAGPYWGQRNLDLSRAAAVKLGFAHTGVATLHTKVVAAPTRAQATYRRGRSYPPAPGFLGIFQSLDLALAQVGRSLGDVLSPPATAGTETKTASVGTKFATARVTTTQSVASVPPRLAVRGVVASPAKVAKRRVRAETKVASRPTKRAKRSRGKSRDVKRQARSTRTASARQPARSEQRTRVARKSSGSATKRLARVVVVAGAEVDVPKRRASKTRRSAAQRAIASNAKPQKAPAVARASKPTEFKSNFRPTRCHGWPNFCGREEG